VNKFVYVINSEEFKVTENLTDKEWIDLTKKKGRIYSLYEFQFAINNKKENLNNVCIRIM
jgi:hypothetical protein